MCPLNRILMRRNQPPSAGQTCTIVDMDGIEESGAMEMYLSIRFDSLLGRRDLDFDHH